MKSILHITSGDIAGDIIAKSGIEGEVFVWHDIHYEGPRKPGWPDEETLLARARFIEETSGGGLAREYVLEALRNQYSKLESAGQYEKIVLWLDACLFDQSMLCHILMCLRHLNIEKADLLCIDSFPGIEPYNGLGQLSPEQLASMYPLRKPVTEEQFLYAERVDRAFVLQDQAVFKELADCTKAPLPWVPAAVKRWMEEQPDESTGLSRLETLALQAVRSGCETPSEIYAFVSARETPPQFWGDTTLWSRINDLADRNPPLVEIDGPMARLPQWDGIADLELFRVYLIANEPMNGTYVHGYHARENRRLHDQAGTLVDLLHSDTKYPAGSLVLEAGCGVGAQTVTLARRSPDARFLSIDVSAESVAEAKQRIEDAGINNVEFRQADIFNLPFDRESFDHVFVCFVLEHLSRPVEALKILKDLIKPGGAITVIEGDHGSTCFHPHSEAAHDAIRCQVRMQKEAGGNALIGRELYPLLVRSGFDRVRVSPRMVYVDSTRPDLVDGFTRKTFTAMIEGVRDSAIAAALIEPERFDAGIRDLYRTTDPDGVFCYTFFKALGEKR
jgi:SAM-dependent methyltransferase